MIVYAESSALVKRYLAERGTTEFMALANMASVMGTVTLTRVELIATFAAARRGNRIDADQHQAVLSRFEADWQNLVRVPPSPNVLQEAELLAPVHSLRAYDAVHLAAALEFQRLAGTPIVLATADRLLWDAGRACNLTVWPDQFTVIQG